MTSETSQREATHSIATAKGAAPFRVYRKRFEDGLLLLQVTDVAFIWIIRIAAGIIVLLLAGIFLTLLVESVPALREFGPGFLYRSVWDPVREEFGALAFLVGTLITSFLALVICIPFSISIAVFLGEYFKEGLFSTVLRSSVELLAGIPSVIYGFWGIFILVPLVRRLQLYLMAKFGFELMPAGVCILAASLILAVMIIPYAASLAREVIALVPADLKEAAYSLGATRYEVVRRVVLPYARSGIFAGIILALGRALGETMAVTMVIGNRNDLPRLKELFVLSPSNTMPSVIAANFGEAAQALQLSSLLLIGLLLFVITAAVNVIGRYVIGKLSAVGKKPVDVAA